MFFCAADPLKSIQCYLKQTHLKEVSLRFPSALVPSSSLPLWTLPLSVHSVSWPWCYVCTARLSVDSWCPDLNTGAPKDSDPNHPFALLYFSCWEKAALIRFSHSSIPPPPPLQSSWLVLWLLYSVYLVLTKELWRLISERQDSQIL